MIPRDGHFTHGRYSVGFDVDASGNLAIAVFDPATQQFVAMGTKPANEPTVTWKRSGGHHPDTIDIEAEIIEPKRLEP